MGQTTAPRLHHRNHTFRCDGTTRRLFVHSTDEREEEHYKVVGAEKRGMVILGRGWKEDGRDYAVDHFASLVWTTDSEMPVERLSMTSFFKALSMNSIG